MLKELTASQRALASYMSELSELAYSAGWIDGLEDDLWRALPDKPFKYGRLDVTIAHLVRLTELSDQCGGWIYFDHEREESFIAFPDWHHRLAHATRLQRS